MADSKLLDLRPELQSIARQFLDACNTLFRTRITETWRNADEQGAAHDKGLSNAKAGESPHNCCDAHGKPSARGFDFAILEKDGTYVKDGADPRYAKAGEIGESLGLVWGGHFPKPDYDHLQLKNWKSLPL